MAPLFEELPFAYVIYDEDATLYCHFCCVKKDKLLRCSSCKFAHYCDKNCQLAARKDHVEECKGLKKMYPKMYPDRNLRMMGRILVKLKRDPKQLEVSVDGERSYEMLMSHSAEIKNDKATYESFLNIQEDLPKFLDEKYVVHGDRLLEIFGKLTINSFSLFDSERGETFGSALYLEMSALNHSCDPDAVFVFSGRKIILNAIKNVELGQEIDWKQLTICYVDQYCPAHLQRKFLRETFYFDCACSFCSGDPRDEVRRNAVRCTYPDCDGPMLIRKMERSEMAPNVFDSIAGQCETCGRENPDIGPSVKVAGYVAKAVSQLKHKMRHISAQDGFNSCIKVTDQVTGTLHPFNLYYNQLLTIGVFALRAIIQPDEEKRQWFRQIHKDYAAGQRVAYYSRPSPAIAENLFRVAELLLGFGELQDLNDAETYLRQAAEEAKITHGEKHEIMNRIDAALDIISKKRVGMKK